jgi:5-methylcytosine-specific restriction endonuclease McrA
MKHKDQIILLREQGKTYSEIQNLLGCSKGTISYHLGVGQREKNIARRNSGRKKVRVYIQEIKQKASCVDCGEDYPYWIMEFDHLGDKSFNISNFHHVTLDLEKVKAEIAKCDIVCSNCHKDRTFRRLLTDGKSAMNVSDYYDYSGD